MAENWQQRIETIASNLLTLEVNTAVKARGISAEKMPELPLALHSLIDEYGSQLQEYRSQVTRGLVAQSAARVIAPDDAADIRRSLQAWDPEADTTGVVNSSDLTNGAETFEAMLWAAVAADSERGRERARRNGSVIDRALIERIGANCRQLREVAILLEQEFSSNREDLQQSTATFPERLTKVAGGGTVDLQPSRLFGGTIDQTVKALFRYPRPVLSIAPDLTILIRKAWDIGLEEIRFQTVLQLDGDVIVRIGRNADAAQLGYLGELHRQAVNDGLAQWHGMFQIIGNLIEGVGRFIFGRSAT